MLDKDHIQYRTVDIKKLIKFELNLSIKLVKKKSEQNEKMKKSVQIQKKKKKFFAKNFFFIHKN